MDIRRPEMDGFEATRQIVALDPDAATHVLITTSTSTSSEPSRPARAASCSRTPDPLTYSPASGSSLAVKS
jgi:CheY-like chemotaxis protein